MGFGGYILCAIVEWKERQVKIIRFGQYFPESLEWTSLLRLPQAPLKLSEAFDQNCNTNWTTFRLGFTEEFLTRNSFLGLETKSATSCNWKVKQSEFFNNVKRSWKRFIKRTSQTHMTKKCHWHAVQAADKEKSSIVCALCCYSIRKQ